MVFSINYNIFIIYYCNVVDKVICISYITKILLRTPFIQSITTVAFMEDFT